MSNVIEFRRPAPPEHRDPTMIIHIYDNGNDKGFSYVVTGQGEPPTKEQLMSYLGDMFLTLSGGPDRLPSIGNRFRAFLSRIFPHKGE